MHVKIEKLTKVFHYTVLDQALAIGRSLLGKGMEEKPVKRSMKAVDEVSFEIREGERVGVIGRNGAGKTTLLKIAAGLAEPSSGLVDVQGRVNCIMTLGVGLREDLTGRENIFIDGEINGRSRREMESVIDEIIAFADIGPFIDQPVRTYSSGMKARLSFAMVIFIMPEILIIDEALSVGDSRFSLKATEKMKEICARGKILIVVSHSMDAIISLCNRCIWLERGRIRMDGHPRDVTAAYVDDACRIGEEELQRRFQHRAGSVSAVPGFRVDPPELVDERGKTRQLFFKGEEMKVRMGVHLSELPERPDLRLAFIRTDGIEMLAGSLSTDCTGCRLCPGSSEFEISVGPVLLGKGVYQVHATLTSTAPDPATPTRVLASSSTFLKVENPAYSYENPAYWWSAEWSFDHPAGNGKRDADLRISTR